MAQPHGDVRVLPEWTTPHMDRLVPPASAELVSHRHRCFNPGNGTSARLDGISRPPPENNLLLHRHHLADRSHRHRELCLPQLPRPYTRLPLTGRCVSASLHPAKVSDRL